MDRLGLDGEDPPGSGHAFEVVFSTVGQGLPGAERAGVVRPSVGAQLTFEDGPLALRALAERRARGKSVLSLKS